MSDIEAVCRYYDRIGRGQDTQCFYEDPATERLLERGDFGAARSVVELGVVPDASPAGCSETG